MKYFFLFFSLFSPLFFTALYAQNTEKLLITQISTDSSTFTDSTQFSYNALRQVTEIITLTQEPGDIWNPKTKFTDYQYNANGKETQHAEQVWDAAGSTWMNTVKHINTYNANNQIKQNIALEWKNNSWKTILRTEYSYDSLNRLTEEWQVEFKRRFLYTYGADGLLIKYIMQDSLPSGWKNNTLAEYGYVPGDSLVSSLEVSNWNNNAWHLSDRAVYEYDQNRNLLEEKYEQYAAGTWKPTFRVIYEYVYVNGTYRFANYIAQDYSNNTWKDYFLQIFMYDPEGNLMMQRSYLSDNGTWEFTFVLFNQYEQTVAAHAPLLVEWKVFPNPVSEVLSVSASTGARVSLLDAQGHVLRESVCDESTGTQMDVSWAPAGTYFVQITDSRSKTVHQKPLMIAH